LPDGKPLGDEITEGLWRDLALSHDIYSILSGDRARGWQSVDGFTVCQPLVDSVGW
jgi:hypothetical protein